MFQNLIKKIVYTNDSLVFSTTYIYFWSFKETGDLMILIVSERMAILAVKS